MTFLEASRIVLEDNLNNPMTASDIWDKIIERGLITEYGKTPKLSLNTILHRSDLFYTIKDKPSEFRKDGSQTYTYYKINCFGREIIDTFFLAIKFLK
jgi:hypothetical protein